ncbi:MAG: amino acid--tRNA ligase-related protein [Candidatus Hodgkinia cicadicola]
MITTTCYVGLMCAALKPNSYTNDIVSVSARIISIRNDRFVVVSDHTNQALQLHVCEAYSPRKCLLLIKLLRVGDQVCASGAVYKDKLGNVSILVRTLKLISKCISTKLMARNLKLRRAHSIFLKACIVRELRRQLTRLGYIELETPILQPLEPSSVNPFVTRHDWRKQALQLRISPEFCLKNYMCVSECKGVFEFAKSFRNEGGSAFHLREFTLLEVYCTNLSWSACLNWLNLLFERLCGLFNRPKPKQRTLSYCELIREQTGYRLELATADVVLELVNKLGLKAEGLRWAEGLSCLFEALVTNMCELVHVTWYPVACSPFARAKWRNSRFAYRFETYWHGVELVNGCVELSCLAEQLKRCDGQLSATLLESLSYGLGYVLGLGIGVDRLTALLFGKASADLSY